MNIPAGWYPANDMPGHERWWDGQAWTPQTRPRATASATQPAENNGVGHQPHYVTNPDQPTKKASKKPLIIGAVGALVAFSALGAALSGNKDGTDSAATDTSTSSTSSATPNSTETSAQSSESQSSTTESTASEATSETSSTTQETPSAPTISGNGTFEVGKDIKPGLYVSTTPDSGNCYYARLKDADDTLDSIIDNGNSSGQSLVQITSSDKYFESSGCSEWTLRATGGSSTPAPKIPGDGTFQVGVDIKPGRYVAASPNSGNCYYARLADLKGSINSIIANNNSAGQSIVVIAPTDKFFESSGCEQWEPRS